MITLALEILLLKIVDHILETKFFQLKKEMSIRLCELGYTCSTSETYTLEQGPKSAEN